MRKGQVWIETVLYTVIGLALIGLILAIAMPRINQSREKVVIDQTIESLSAFDRTVREVAELPVGNKRTIDAFTMKKGTLYINASGDSIIFYIDELSAPSSEVGVPIQEGRVTRLTTEDGGKYSVTLTLDYAGYANITARGNETLITLTAAAVPYSFEIEGKDAGLSERIPNVDIRETSGR